MDTKTVQVGALCTGAGAGVEGDVGDAARRGTLATRGRGDVGAWKKKLPGSGAFFWRGIKLAGRIGRRSSGAGAAVVAIRLRWLRLYGPTGARCGSVVQIRVAFESLSPIHGRECG